jgi:hypothetical protein
MQAQAKLRVNYNNANARNRKMSILLCLLLHFAPVNMVLRKRKAKKSFHGILD